MPLQLQFSNDSWDAYLEITKNKRYKKKINNLIKEMRRTPAEGTGQPEELKHELSSLWSRRFDKGERIIYSFDEDVLIIIAIGGHYNDR